jgi:hypothetical protein
MPKTNARTLLYDAGGKLIDTGKLFQYIATPRREVTEMQVPVTPMSADEALILVDTLDFLENFARTGIVGTSIIVRFGSPLHRKGDTYSLAGVKMLFTHPNVPQGKKVKKVRIHDDVVISKIKLPESDFLWITEMNAVLQSDGKWALIPTAGVSFATPVAAQPQPIPMWAK